MIDLSIVIVTFNYEKYICDCINSCLLQEENDINVEILVIDDGSQDSTSELVNKNFKGKVKYYRIKNSGIEEASNYGFNLAKGKYIVRVDADDLLSKNYIKNISKYLNKNYDFIFSNYKTIDKEGHLIEEIKLPEFSKTEILKRGDFLATGTLLRSYLISKFGGYECKIKNCGLENYEFIIKLLINKSRGFRIPEFLFCYRIHNKNLSRIKKKKIQDYGQEIFNKYNLGKYFQNKYHPYARYQ